MADQTEQGTRGNSKHEIPVEGAQRDQKEREVLICMDGSEHADRAFDWYAENVHRPENDVIMIHAAEMPTLSGYAAFGAGFSFSSEEWTRISEEHTAKIKELQQVFENKMRSHHMHGKIVFRLDSPDAAICDYVKEHNIDVIVMGTRGLGTLRRTIMGSTSDYVLHHAGTPVFVIPPPTST